MKTLAAIETPQLVKLHSGKVRESFRLPSGERLIVVTDRISAFDRVLTTPVPCKGAVLGSMAHWWFEATRHIVDNHLVRTVDPQVSIVREAQPIRIEMVVRGYVTGSMWRYYEKGKRSFSGVQVPEGLKRNQRLPTPILTPTTKEDSDREITPADIVREGWTSEGRYAEMAEVAQRLFAEGTKRLAERGIILVDTKYEFGLVGYKLILIDEIHTPDSSRFWSAEAYARDPSTCTELDKEYVRQWLLAQPEEKRGALAPEVIAETSRRYLAIYEKVTGKPLALPAQDPAERIRENLVREGILKEAYVAVVMGSPGDLPHAERLKEALQRYGVAVDLRDASAHKNGEDVARLAAEYNGAIEPGAVIAVAGLSNGLGGALAANLNVPVINCPPYKDQVDLALNINSSLMMPSKVPAATVVGVESAALAALRSLNLRSLRERFAVEITEMKDHLRREDLRVRGRA